MNNKKKPTTVGFIPWWPENPYQVLLREHLCKLGFRIIGDPVLSILRLLMFQDKLDIVHLHWPFDLYYKNYWRLPYVICLLILYRILKNNIVWTVHELNFYETRYKIVDHLIIKILMKLSKALIVHSEFSANEIFDKYSFKRKIIISKHPSYFGYYPNSVMQQEAKAKFFIPDGGVSVLFFGHVKPHKGVEELINSFKKIKHSYYRLIIAGAPINDKIKSRIEMLAKNEPRIMTKLHYITDLEVQDFMNAADIVACPFRACHTSGSALLALSFGKPVIVPRIASLPEYVPENAAIYFDPDNIDSLDNALSSVEHSDLIKMGENALAAARQLSWDRFAADHVLLYNA